MAPDRHLDRLTPAANLVGREVLEVDSRSGVVRLAFVARPEFANRHGTTSGGFLAAMLDSAAAAPILAFLPEDLTVVTTDLRVSFERPAALGQLFGAGRVAERSDREVRAKAELMDPGGAVVARATATFRILRRRRATGQHEQPMPRAPLVRRFDPQEWAIYRDLRLRALAQDPDAFGSTLALEKDRSDRAWAERLAGSDPRWSQPLLAELSGEPVGLAWGRIEPARRERADLYQMWVEPSCRRQGAARLLLEAVITWARGAGAEYLALSVTRGAVASTRLYLSAGFEPTGHPEPLRPGSRLMAQPMRLDLRKGVGLDTLVSGIAHIGIRVRDLSTSRAFYEDLGFRFIAGPLGPEPVAILEHPAGIVLNLILNASSSEVGNVLMDVPEKHPGYTHVSLAVEDLEQVQRAVQSLGITITEGPVQFPGARALFIRDPDGNVVELNQSVPAG